MSANNDMIVRFLQKIKRAAQKIHVLLTVCKIKKNRSVKSGSETKDFSQLSSIYFATAVSIRLPRVREPLLNEMVSPASWNSSAGTQLVPLIS